MTAQAIPNDSTSQQRSALKVQALSVSYQETMALHAIDADFSTHQMSAIIGPNGAGKSTLLKAIMGIIPALTGEVQLFGERIQTRNMSQKQRQQIAYIPQRKSVDWDFPVTVHDVVAMGLTRELGLLGRMTAEHKQRIAQALEQVSMQDFARRQIGALSGGQQQRVFMARALIQNARILLLDEPFAGVDAATEQTLFKVLSQLRAQGCCVIVVHHDLANLQHYFDSALLLRGRVIAQGTVDQVLDQANISQAYGAPLYYPAQTPVTEPR